MRRLFSSEISSRHSNSQAIAPVGLSLPELIILRRVLKPQLIAVFVATLAVAIIVTGYLFNWFI